jgi:1,4-alpha-glucan branching enzyme
MIKIAKKNELFAQRMADLRLIHEDNKVIVFYRHGLLFAFNFHPTLSQTKVRVPLLNKADYTVALSSDDAVYGGWDRMEHIKYPVHEENGELYLDLYLPAQTAIVLKEGKIKMRKKKV